MYSQRGNSMFRNCVSFGVALTLLLVLGGCIKSSRDIAKDNLSSFHPLTPGTYNEGPDNTVTVLVNGDGYLIQEKSRRPTLKGRIKIIDDTHQVRFFKISELPEGYIVQKNVEDVFFEYCFAKVHAASAAVTINCPDGRDWARFPSKIKTLTNFTGTKKSDWLFNDIEMLDEENTLAVLRDIAKLDLKMSYGRTFIKQ
jgi:hypothetical protein